MVWSRHGSRPSEVAGLTYLCGVLVHLYYMNLIQLTFILVVYILQIVKMVDFVKSRP